MLLVGGLVHFKNGVEARVPFEWQEKYSFGDARGDCFGRSVDFCNLKGGE